jgi:hypothetical protein
MAKIKAVFEPDLVVFHASGPVTRDDILATVREYYPERVAKHIIWDFTPDGIETLTTEDMKAIATEVKATPTRRVGGRTAYVGSENFTYTLTCMYTAVATMAQIPVEYSVFRKISEAREWIARSEQET